MSFPPKYKFYEGGYVGLVIFVSHMVFEGGGEINGTRQEKEGLIVLGKHAQTHGKWKSDMCERGKREHVLLH